MKTYLYLEQGEHWTKDVIHTVTEKDILDAYWPVWYPLMVKKYGEGHEFITEENCIADFVTVNWAWEKPDD